MVQLSFPAPEVKLKDGKKAVWAQDFGAEDLAAALKTRGTSKGARKPKHPKRKLLKPDPESNEESDYESKKPASAKKGKGGKVKRKRESEHDLSAPSTDSAQTQEDVDVQRAISASLRDTRARERSKSPAARPPSVTTVPASSRSTRSSKRS